MARTFEPLQPVLYQVLEGNQTVPNAPKWYETCQNMSLEPFVVDQVRLLRKIPTRLRDTNFCTSSARFALSFVTQQTVPNAPK